MVWRTVAHPKMVKNKEIGTLPIHLKAMQIREFLRLHTARSESKPGGATGGMIPMHHPRIPEKKLHVSLVPRKKSQ